MNCIEKNIDVFSKWTPLSSSISNMTMMDPNKFPIDASLILRFRQNQQAIREPKTAYTEKIPNEIRRFNN